MMVTRELGAVSPFASKANGAEEPVLDVRIEELLEHGAAGAVRVRDRAQENLRRLRGVNGRRLDVSTAVRSRKALGESSARGGKTLRDRT